MEVVSKSHVLRELLDGLLSEHLECLDAIYELLELDHLLVDVGEQKGGILMPIESH